MKRILADFNPLNSEPLDLVKLGHTSRLSEPLQPGEVVELYDDEIAEIERRRRVICRAESHATSHLIAANARNAIER